MTRRQIGIIAASALVFVLVMGCASGSLAYAASENEQFFSDLLDRAKTPQGAPSSLEIAAAASAATAFTFVPTTEFMRYTTLAPAPVTLYGITPIGIYQPQSGIPIYRDLKRDLSNPGQIGVGSDPWSLSSDDAEEVDRTERKER